VRLGPVLAAHMIAVLVVPSRAAPPACKPVPIEEAIRVGREFAERWRPVVELVRVDTAHPPLEWEERATPPGLDGRRCVWNFEVKDPRTHAFIMFRVANGSVIDVDLKAGTDTGRGFPPSAFRLTGKDLADKAKQAGILPAKPPGTAGYSYYLRRAMGHFRRGPKQQDVGPMMLEQAERHPFH
jgi:hypothetical protein